MQAGHFGRASLDGSLVGPLGGKFTVLGKWMHDFSAENRFESDYVTLTGAWQF